MHQSFEGLRLREKRGGGPSAFPAASVRRAAVTFAIERASPHGVLFIERAAHLRHHAGEIALPGGAVEPEDRGDLERTALRELEEEVGIAPARVAFVGKLSDVTPRVSGYVVTPFVALIDPGPLVVDGNEVAGIFTIPLGELLERGVTEGKVDVGAFRVHSYIFEYGSARIWGMTARVLEEFVRTWKQHESQLRRDVERGLARI